MHARLSVIQTCLYILGAVVLTRLFYWQVIQSSDLSVEAVEQRTTTERIAASRGSILSDDGFILTSNREYYQLYAYKPQLELSLQDISQKLAPLALSEPRDATEAAKPIEQRVDELEKQLLSDLSNPDKKWVPLVRGITKEQKEQIQTLEILGVGFDPYEKRYYPEASMSAHILGFVGHDDQGNPQGYFGLEGHYNMELQGREGRITQEKDAFGRPILIGTYDQLQSRQGRDLQLYLNRSMQHIAETRLLEALERYGAKSGEVTIMDPSNGAILASAAFPNYDASHLSDFPQSVYKNPVIANSYEPGSTFKTIVMAAGIESGVITPETVCGSPCSAPTKIGKYSIRTWNNQYDPTQTMTDVLANSDNTGMVFVAQQMGKEAFVEWINDFGFGQITGVDLQEEATPDLRQQWGDIDVATASFGQGLAVTNMQMLRAVSVIANGGYLVKPMVVKSVDDGTRVLPIKKTIEDRLISEETAQKVTQMMIESAHHGEAQWTVLKDYTVAGKTGTAQIPIDGHYDEEKTIASFVGFAPAEDPSFVMLVKLREPESSQWASETAAPLWYQIAHDLMIYLNIPPKNSK